MFRSTIPAFFMAACVASCTSSQLSASQPGITVGPGERVVIFTDSDNQEDQTGITFTNQSQETGSVDVVPRKGPPMGPNDTTAEDFVLLDNFLDITTFNIPDGQKRLQVRMEYRAQRLRRLGLRENTIRVLRRDARLGQWRPAVRAIRDRRMADIRRIRGRATERLGNYGFDPDNTYAWSVVDVTSQYALGARPVPEPLALTLLASGIGVLLVGRRRRSIGRESQRA